MNGNVLFTPSPPYHCPSDQMGKTERTIEFMSEDVRERLKCILKTSKGSLSVKSFGLRR